MYFKHQLKIIINVTDSDLTIVPQLKEHLWLNG